MRFDHFVGVELSVQCRDEIVYARELASDQREISRGRGEMAAGTGHRGLLACPSHQSRSAPAILSFCIKVLGRQLPGRAQRFKQVQAKIGEQPARLVTGIALQAAKPDKTIDQPLSVLLLARCDCVAHV